LRNKDRRIPANAFVAVSSLLGALLIPVVIFWLSRTPPLIRRLPRYFSSADWRTWLFSLVAGLFILE
jgi:hypothetical protein